MLFSTNKTNQERERQHAAKMIEALNRAMRAIQRQGLDVDGQSAQKAFAEGSYAEAVSLADKASMVIAPLAATPAAASP
jgi:hypothetical protein